jgi:hypothetical protein
MDGGLLAFSLASAEEAAHMLKKTLSALTVVAALGGSMLIPATATAGESVRPVITVRFFDRTHHDYHRWDRAEDVRYRAYLTERHRRYVAFQRASRQRQLAYWRWRHERY